MEQVKLAHKRAKRSRKEPSYWSTFNWYRLGILLLVLAGLIILGVTL